LLLKATRPVLNELPGLPSSKTNSKMNEEPKKKEQEIGVWLGTDRDESR
jgi:hypothetical protein